jgi:uncharacterized membrane protein YbhN (UPF0104 family)
LRRLDRHELAESLRAADRGWVLAAIVSVLVTLTLVTVRWGLLAAPDPGRSRWRVLWHSVVVGQAVNILVPLRFGEGARVVMTARHLGLPVGRVVTAVAVERVFDVAAFLAAGLFVFSIGALPEGVADRAPLAAAFAVVTVLGLIALVRLLPYLAGGEPRSANRFVRWLQTQAAAAGHGWTAVASTGRLFVVSALTVVILLASASTNLLMLRAFDLAIPATAALVLLIVLQIGTAVVSVPGNIGVFHYLTVLTLAQWQVPPATALAVAIVLHAVSIGPKLLLAPFAVIDRPARA